MFLVFSDNTADGEVEYDGYKTNTKETTSRTEVKVSFREPPRS